jgi:hypothetical protein
MNPNQYQLIDRNQYEDMLNQVKKFGSRPDRPEFESLLDDTGMIKEQYRIQDNLNTQYLDRMRDTALRDPGQASQLRQLQQQQLEQQGAQAQAQAQSSAAQQMNQMAMRGGLRSGAQERMAQNAANRGLQARQQMLAQGTQLDLADEQNRLKQLGALGQQEMARAQFGRQGDQFNIEKSLFDVLQKRAADMNAYNEEMRAWASERTAAATPSGGGGKK